MLERISEWFKRLPIYSRFDSSSDLDDIHSLIPIISHNCFSPKNCYKKEKEKTELYLTWYAKGSFYECYHNKGSLLLEKPWKSLAISTHVSNDTFYVIFVDMCTLNHKIFDLADKTSWRGPCHTMLEKKYRPSRLFTKYNHPFNSKDFESFARCCGYIMCGWNSRLFLQKQILHFGESYEIMDKVKYILNNSSTVENDLSFLKMNLNSNDSNESEKETDEEAETLSSNDGKFETASFENTRTDGTTKNRKLEQIFDSKINRSELKHSKQQKQLKSENVIENNSMTFNYKDSKKGTEMPSTIIGSKLHFDSENKRIKNNFLHTNVKKILENRRHAGKKWECVLLEMTVKEDMFYFIFMDADSCYPQVIESEGCDESSCIIICKTFLERYPGTKELHVPTGKPFESEELKEYLKLRGIKYYFNSPLVQYLKEPRAAFGVIKRIISRNYSNEKRSRVLSEFVKKKVITRNISGRKGSTLNDVYWKGNRVIAAKMTNGDGDYLVLVDLEKALVEAYPKKPNGRFIFPQEMIVAFVQAFKKFGIPKELHTIGGSLFDTPQFDRLVEHCYVKHCRDCWHAKQGNPYFNLLEKVKCCFARTSDIQSAIILWGSLRERLKISRRRRGRAEKHQPKKYSKSHRKNIYKHSKSFIDSHGLTSIREASRRANDKMYKEKKIDKHNDLGKLSTRNKSSNLNSTAKKAKRMTQINGAKYQKMLNKLLKHREESLENMSNVPMKQKNIYEELKKKQSNKLSKYKKMLQF